MKSCRQIKIFPESSYYMIEALEKDVNLFCENHEVIEIIGCDSYIMVVYRDLKEVEND